MSVASVGYNPVSALNFSGDVRPQPILRNETTQPQQTKVKPQVHNSTTSDLERLSLAFNKKLKFVVDHHSNEVIVKVIDKETDKVIKELPPEELQRLHTNLREAIGRLFDEKV